MRQTFKKIVQYFVRLAVGEIDIWGSESSVWGPIVDEKIGIDYRRGV